MNSNFISWAKLRGEKLLMNCEAGVFLFCQTFMVFAQTKSFRNVCYSWQFYRGPWKGGSVLSDSAVDF